MTIETNMIVKYCNEYTNISLAHLISSLNLLPYIPVTIHPILRMVAKTIKEIPNSFMKNGNGIKQIIQKNICLFVVANPFTTGNIGILAVRYSSTLLMANA